MVNQFLVGLSLVVIVVAIARFGRPLPPEAESQQAVATTGRERQTRTCHAVAPMERRT
jgi:hypothetical protein